MRVAAFLALSIVISAAALAEPPKVDVRFLIEAQQFVDGLQGSRASVERALTQTLLDESRDQKSFPFINWMNGDASAANGLVVALVQRRAGSDFEMLVEYRGTIRGGAMPPALQEVVYRWFEAKYADTSEVVKARLQKKLRDQFANETFRRNLLRYFVSQVPLAENVDIDVPGHRVIVPVAAMNLQADEQQSELAVAFFGKSDGRPGTMMLRDPLDFPPRGVLCRIKDFNFPGVALAGDWSDRIPQVFGPSKVRDVRVTMVTYVPKFFPDSRAGSLTHD